MKQHVPRLARGLHADRRVEFIRASIGELSDAIRDASPGRRARLLENGADVVIGDVEKMSKSKRNTVPPGMETPVCGCCSRQLTMCSELVRTCSFRCSRCGHMCRVVEPPSMITASPDWSLEQAAAEMSRRSVRHLVVFDEGEVVGILSMRDIVRVWTSAGATSEMPLPSGAGGS